MKNFNILGIHGKIRVLRGFQEKPIYRGRFGQFVDLMGLGKKVGGRVFLSGGGDNPMHTMLSI